MGNTVLPIRKLDDVRGEVRNLLANAQQTYGFVPNILGVMANAPSALKGYMTLSSIFDETSLSPTERQIVLLTVSFENECAYCMVAHSGIAKLQKVDEEIITALQEGKPLVDDKLEALRLFTREIITTRGWPSEEAKNNFLEVGYDPSVMLEVVLGVALKTLSNYTNHLADTELD